MKRPRSIHMSDEVWAKIKAGAYEARLNMDDYINQLLGGNSDDEKNNVNVREGIQSQGDCENGAGQVIV